MVGIRKVPEYPETLNDALLWTLKVAKQWQNSLCAGNAVSVFSERRRSSAAAVIRSTSESLTHGAAVPLPTAVNSRQRSPATTRK
jgi:hypothetical protein